MYSYHSVIITFTCYFNYWYFICFLILLIMFFFFRLNAVILNFNLLWTFHRHLSFCGRFQLFLKVYDEHFLLNRVFLQVILALPISTLAFFFQFSPFHQVHNLLTVIHALFHLSNPLISIVDWFFFLVKRYLIFDLGFFTFIQRARKYFIILISYFPFLTVYFRIVTSLLFFYW